MKKLKKQLEQVLEWDKIDIKKRAVYHAILQSAYSTGKMDGVSETMRVVRNRKVT